jgi:hypothetical protein
MSAAEAEEAVAYLGALPRVVASARCEVEGEEEIMEGDPLVKCKVGKGGHGQGGGGGVKRQGHVLSTIQGVCMGRVR